MKYYQRVLLVFACLVLCVGSTLSWIERPKRIRKEFFSLLFHERYDEAALMLDLPSALQLGPGGDLILFDHKGNSTTVSKTNLPFVVGGGRTESPEVHTMTALGERENGILKSPMVTIYLTVQGRKISIQSIES